MAVTGRSAASTAPTGRDRRFAVHLAAAATVLAAAIWLSSGTMAPYAATAQYPTILEPCHYLINIDHDQFVAPFRFLSGDPPESWAWSVVLRRLLFPIVAFPLAKAFGLLIGGVLTSAILHLAALLAFGIFVRRRVGETAAIAVSWILATYPGVTYWAGLPYSYVTIVPGSLVCMMSLYRLLDAPTLRDAITASLLMGLVFLGYDLFPFFGVAGALILLSRRRWGWAAAASAAMAVPTLLVLLMFAAIGVPVINSNTAGYLIVARSYLPPYDVRLWLHYLFELPLVFLSNFVFGNLIVLPLLFVAAWIVAARRRVAFLAQPDKMLLMAGLLLFLFNNAAPPYLGWQLRGHWIARLYQPLFPALLMAIGCVSERLADRRWWRAAIAAGVLVNASIAFGPVLMNPLAAEAYRLFYVHSPADSLLVNLRHFGRRPLGFCRESHEWDSAAEGMRTWRRPLYMYRPFPGEE